MIAQALSAALLQFVWQGLLVSALLWIALQLLARRSANVRYAICCAALVMLIAWPVITTWALYHRDLPVAAGQTVAPSATLTGNATGHPDAPSIDWLSLIQAWTLPVWSIGVLFFSARIAWGCTHVAALRRRGAPAAREVLSTVEALSHRMGLTRSTQVLISSLTTGPSVVGWLRPVILLPAAALTGLSPQQLEAVLAHELAHIRRHDYLVNLLQMLAEALLFYHPAVWWVSARIRTEREFCCDDLAVRACQDALCYARALTTLEKLRLTTPVTALGSTAGPLLQRVQRLVGAPARECGPSRLSAILALSLSLAGIALNVRSVHGQATTEAGRTVQVAAMGVTILSQTPIEYPAAAKAARAHGNVVVNISIDAEGNVTDASVFQPRMVAHAPIELQRAALAAVRKWRFAEGPPADAPVEGYKAVAVTFQAPPTPVQAYIKEGDALYKAGQDDKALRWYEQGEQKFPEQKIDFLKRECEVYIRLNDQAAVKATLNKIFKENSGDVEARGLRASIHLDEGGDKNEVVSELTEVINAKPDNFVARFNLGRTYFAMARYDDAARQFTVALRLRPDYVPARTARTQLEMKQGDYSAALQDTDEILRRKPDEASGKILKSAALAHLQRYDEARTLIQEVLAKDPQNPEALAQQKALSQRP